MIKPWSFSATSIGVALPISSIKMYDGSRFPLFTKRGFGWDSPNLNTASWRSHPSHSCFKRDLHEADSFVRHLPTAKAAGYSATAPTGLASSAAAHYTP